MKHSLILLLLFSNLLFAQESQDKITYTDSLGVEVAAENKFYTKVTKDYYLEKESYQILTYYKNGQLKKDVTVNGKDGGSPIGAETEYYENGNKCSAVSHSNGQIHGKATEWYENGKLKKEGEYNIKELNTDFYYKITSFWNPDGKQTVTDGNGEYEDFGKRVYERGHYRNGFREGEWRGSDLNSSFVENYKNGKLTSGESSTNDGIKIKYKTVFKRPEPKKGISDFYKFIGKNFNTSDEVYKKKISGRIIIGFVVDKEGQIIEPKVVRGLGYGLDEEAIRVLLAYEKWEPAQQRGQNVRCSFQIPIAIQAID